MKNNHLILDRKGMIVKMEFKANEGKKVEITVGDNIYLRHAIKTRFINPNDNYIDIIREYVSEIYETGDIISISEKIISICQNRIIRRETIKIGIWAKLLSKFANQSNKGGYGVGMPINMQYAINKVRLGKGYVCKYNKSELQNCWE